MAQNNEVTGNQPCASKTLILGGKLILNPSSFQNRLQPSCRNPQKTKFRMFFHHSPLLVPKLLHKLNTSMDVSGRFGFLGKWLYGIDH